MFGSAALGAVRPVLAAATLPQADFGYYTSIIGLVGFGSMLVSFGTVEATNKLYPRLWVGGHRVAIWQDAIATFMKIGRWMFLPALLGVVLSFFGVIPIGVAPIFLIGLFVWLAVMLNLSAAIIRATNSLRLLQVFGFLRSSVPLLLVGVALVWSDWLVAIAAETLAAAITGLVGGFLIFRQLKSEVIPTQNALEIRSDSDGRTLYFANLLSSSISLVDRAIVTAVLGAVQGGAYGMATLVVQAGSLLIGIISQKVGPEVIQHVYRGSSLKSALVYFKFPVAALALAGCLLLATYVAGVTALPVFRVFLVNHGIGHFTVFLAAVLVVLQIYMFLPFFLLAVDDEKAVLLSGITGFLIFASGVALACWLVWPMEAFLIAAIAARLAQILVSLGYIKQRIGVSSKDNAP